MTNLWDCKVGHAGIGASLDISPRPSRNRRLVWCWPEIWRYVKCDILLQRSNQGWWRGIVGEIKHVAGIQGVANWLQASGSHLWLCTLIFLLLEVILEYVWGKKWHSAMCNKSKTKKVWIGKVYASGLYSPKCTVLGFDMCCLSTCQVNSQRRKLLGSSSEFQLFVFLCYTTIGSTAKRLSVENVD